MAKTPSTKKKMAKVAFQVRVTQELRGAIEVFRLNQEFEVGLNDFCVKAFQEFLKNRNAWPPPKPKA